MTNRASWFQPPYVPAVGPTPTPTATPAFTPTPTPTATAKLIHRRRRRRRYNITPTPSLTPTRTPTRTPTGTRRARQPRRHPDAYADRHTDAHADAGFTPTSTPTAVAAISPICGATARGGGTKITIKVCDGTSGNVYIASISSLPSTTITPPSGWTTIGQKNTSLLFTTFWHRSSGSEPASYTWTCGGTCYPAGGIEAYRGVVGGPAAQST